MRPFRNGLHREERLAKLREAGAKQNSDHPRISGGQLRLPRNEKLYGYHIVAADAAVTAPTPTLTPDRLKMVSRKKDEDGALTIMHQCGHRWCFNGRHLSIGTKVYNDEQAACHRMLMSARSLEEYRGAQAVCRHATKCWTLLYGGHYADDVRWADE